VKRKERSFHIKRSIIKKSRRKNKERENKKRRKKDGGCHQNLESENKE